MIFFSLRFADTNANVEGNSRPPLLWSARKAAKMTAKAGKCYRGDSLKGIQS
jgi:hypothetical protein